MEQQLDKKIETCLSDLEDIIACAKELRGHFMRGWGEQFTFLDNIVDDCEALYKKIEEL